jgi:hypothetical protein
MKDDADKRIDFHALPSTLHAHVLPQPSVTLNTGSARL